MMRRILVGYLFLWHFSVVSGQQLFVQKYPREVYRGSDQTWGFAQDKNGMLYAAESNGVLQFNGYVWKLMPIPDNKAVYSFAFDSRDVLYVGSHKELGYLQKDGQGISRYHSLTARLPAPYRNFRDIGQIIVIRDTVFFCNGSYVFRYAHNSFTIFPAKAGQLLLLKGQLYLWDANGFHVYKNTGFEESPLTKELQGIKVWDIKGYTGNSWLLLDDHNKIWIFDPDALPGRRFRLFLNGSDRYFKDFRIWDMAYLDNGRIMVYSVKGLFFFTADGQLSNAVSKDMLGADLFYGNFYQDAHHNIWLATISNIFHILINSPLSYYDKVNGFVGRVVSLGLSGADRYVGTGRGIFHEENAGTFSPVPGTEGIAWNFYNFHGKLYVANSTGVLELSGKTAKKMIDQEDVQSLCELNNDPDHLLMGTVSTGIFLLEKKGNGWIKRKIRGFEEWTRYMQQDSAGYIWIGDGREVIFRVRLNTRMDSVIRTDFYDDKKGLPAGSYNRPCRRPDGEVVITTVDGIYKYDPGKDRFQPIELFRKALGPGTYINSMAEDSAGNIYFRSGSEQYSEMAGILNRQPDGSFTALRTPFNKIALPIPGFSSEEDPILIVSPHEVWIGASEKLVSYDPSPQKPPFDEPLRLFIEQVRVKDSLVFIGGTGNGGLKQPIPYHSNTLRFRFITSDFENPEKMEYQYKLDGFENSWSFWVPNRDAVFTNLPEGDYTIQVRAKNQYGKISNIESLSFRILPPLYRSWWAGLLYLAAFLLLLYGILRLNDKRIRQKNRALEKKVEEKTRELKSSNEEILEKSREIADQAKTLLEVNKSKDKLFSIVAHDLRGPISIIQSTVDVMKEGSLSEQELRSFSGELSDHLMVTGYLLKNLLFWAQTQMDGIKAMPSAFDIQEVSEENCLLFRAHAEARGIRLINQVDAGIWVHADKDIVTMVLRNLINNAVKFTREGGEVIVGAELNKDQVELFVQDTGVGLSASDISKIVNRQLFHRVDTSGQYGSGLGLLLCQDLIEKDGGKIRIESRLGEGSRFSFRIPVLKDRENAALLIRSSQ
ncbi:MAG TPA: HAMP domain-containing sensor histidine kinase [Puia sp.]|nr:HAMP domain-containing sensor histidine kinase [Puia sp.]